MTKAQKKDFLKFVKEYCAVWEYNEAEKDMLRAVAKKVKSL